MIGKEEQKTKNADNTINAAENILASIELYLPPLCEGHDGADLMGLASNLFNNTGILADITERVMLTNHISPMPEFNNKPAITEFLEKNESIIKSTVSESVLKKINFEQANMSDKNKERN